MNGFLWVDTPCCIVNHTLNINENYSIEVENNGERVITTGDYNPWTYIHKLDQK